MVSKIRNKAVNRYGLALRDHDIDVIRARNSALVNRYTLMDVSLYTNSLLTAIDSILRGKTSSV